MKFPFSRTSFILASVAVLAGCGSSGSSLATSPAASRVAPASGGQVQVNLTSERNGSVTRNPVGTVAFVSGIDQRSGQIVAATGISGTPDVGSVRTSGTATYETQYGYEVVDRITRSSTFISGQAGRETGTLGSVDNHRVAMSMAQRCQLAA